AGKTYPPSTQRQNREICPAPSDFVNCHRFLPCSNPSNREPEILVATGVPVNCDSPSLSTRVDRFPADRLKCLLYGTSVGLNATLHVFSQCLGLAPLEISPRTVR